jgi:hypothetical protein
MSSLLLRYFRTSAQRVGLSQVYKIATQVFMRANGEELRQVVLSLDSDARLKEVIPLTHEIAATVWHRGTLVEMPGGEVVLSE